MGSLLRRLSPRTRLIIGLAIFALTFQTLVLIRVTPGVQMKFDVFAAHQALRFGKLNYLGSVLARHRGDPEFAHRFAADLTPRRIGDGIGKVAGSEKEAPLRPGVDPARYELALTDLAGVLALATHGTGARALPARWAEDMATAMTRPAKIYPIKGSLADKNPFSRTDAEKRRDQDEANRSNLMLLLARGYWSTDFLKTTTKVFYAYDRAEDEDAWPDADPGDDYGWAPAPNGAYLTDGVLALTAALTANSSAAAWAFTDFKKGQVTVEGSEKRINRFTHFLMFEHRFPDQDGAKNVGMTASLAALSSGISALDTAETQQEPKLAGDAAVLRAAAIDAANDAADGDGCSFNPLNYGNCVVGAFKKVWTWIRGWGHAVLSVLSLASLAPPPFTFLGLGAAALNATWYVLEGDFAGAGLSLAAVAPALALAKVGRGAKVAKAAGAVRGARAAGLAAKANKVAGKVQKIAKRWRPTSPWKDCDRLPVGGIRLAFKPGWNRAQRREAAAKTRTQWMAAQRGELRKTAPQRSGPSAKVQWEKKMGPVPKGKDIDQIQDLQLGGADDLGNLRPLDRSVNRSLGKQTAARMARLDIGDTVPGIAIC